MQASHPQVKQKKKLDPRSTQLARHTHAPSTFSMSPQVFRLIWVPGLGLK